ncbi:hypothetical protein [Methanopyrus kandleri]|uniref:Uncharacterized secreted protein specific for M.kandleri, MK-30 family n=2 Tax=Methanopyrus kandleri TaxID=2320 RepID=Q8TYG9_METKA|nr:hypothetical protein [Methanopyrus kandleri]AAM01545.1 Uncharacterized secreted protein specific for M.kandleri, MK-30 family [Methanopyrus kandleri AV19]HII70517.1 hypothetical protein [Methanopyrus kandleri]
MLGAALAAILLVLPGSALADAWSPVSKVHLTERTELTLTDQNTVRAHLTVEVLGYGLEGSTRVPIKVLVPSDAELVTAKWKPERGGEVEVEPVSVRTVTWPGNRDQIEWVTYNLHSGSTPYMDALEALFPNKMIRWRELTFVLPVEGTGGYDEQLGTLEVVTTCRTHEGEQGTYFAWPIPAAANPAYEVRVHGLSVGFVAVYDPETGRWRWIVPGEWSYSAPPSSRSANVNTVIVDVAGLPFGLSVEAGGVRVDPGPTWKASRFLSLTRYLPVLVVMEISPVGPAPQRGETASERGTTESTGGIVPTPLIVPIVPVRRR